MTMILFAQVIAFGLSGFTIIQVLALSFLAITFLETGLSKLFNYRGGLTYFTDHFKNSPLAKSIPLLFPIILLQEVITGILSVIGLITLMNGSSRIAALAFALGAFTFLNLYFGQRMAKDYVGATGIVPYIIASIGGLFLFV